MFDKCGNMELQVLQSGCIVPVSLEIAYLTVPHADYKNTENKNCTAKSIHLKYLCRALWLLLGMLCKQNTGNQEATSKQLTYSHSYIFFFATFVLSNAICVSFVNAFQLEN